MVYLDFRAHCTCGIVEGRFGSATEIDFVGASPDFVLTQGQPGPTATDMSSAHAEIVKPLIPLKRMGDVSEIAGFVSYLASEEAGFITGASLTIDGGYVA